MGNRCLVSIDKLMRGGGEGGKRSLYYIGVHRHERASGSGYSFSRGHASHRTLPEEGRRKKKKKKKKKKERWKCGHLGDFFVNPADQ